MIPDLMDVLPHLDLSVGLWAYACGVAVLAGLVKGMVGFAMPMVLISGLSTVFPPEIALAWLILPTLVTNLWQALRQGVGAAFLSLKKFWLFLVAGGVCMVAAAPLVPLLPGAVMLLILGVPISIYALTSLAGHPPRLPPNPGRRAEAGMGALAGVFGGLSGVWGPPTVALLTALETPKQEQVRVQGVVFGLGALILVAAHTASGVFNAQTAPMSALLVVPSLAGLALGFAIQDRTDQRLFRRLTLLVLLVAGLNLVRRGVLGL